MGVNFLALTRVYASRRRIRRVRRTRIYLYLFYFFIYIEVGLHGLRLVKNIVFMRV